MSTYTEIEEAIAGTIETAVGSLIPVYRLVDPGQIDLQRHQAAVSLILGQHSRSPSEELGAVLNQDEEWLWLVYVVAAVPIPASEGRTAAYDILTSIYTALCPSTGYQPDSYCGHMEHTATEFVGFLPAGALYVARYTHTRWTG